MSNVATLTDPTFVTRDSANSIGVSALDARFGVGGMSAPSSSSTLGYASGVFPGAASGTTILDCQVIQASSANMTVQIAPGNYQVGRANLGAYLGAVTGNTSVTVGGSNGSNPRIDYVILRVREPTVDGTITASVTPMVLPGSAAANPTETTAASQLTDGDLLLAAVRVRAGTTSILQSDISDKRAYVSARGGIGVKSAVDTAVGAFPGQYKDDGTALVRWNGTSAAWEAVASPAVWSSWSAPLNTATGVVNIGSSGTYACRYLRTGKRGDLSFTWTTGGTGINVKTGEISSVLPPGWVSRALGETHMSATLYTAALGNVSAFLMQGDCVVLPNDNVMHFRFPYNGNTSVLGQFIGSTGSGVGTGTPVVPNGYWGNPGSILAVTGVIELQ